MASRIEAVDENIRQLIVRMQRPGQDRHDDLTYELNDLARRRTELLVMQDEIEAAREGIKQQQREGTLRTNPMVLQALDRDPTLRRMEAQLKDFMARKEVLEMKYGPKHPVRKAFEENLRSLQNGIAEYRQELMDVHRQALISQFDNEYAATSRKLGEIELRLGEVRSRRSELAQDMKKLTDFEARKEGMKERLTKVEDRLQELRLLESDVPAKMLYPAETPLEPDWPKLEVLIPVGVFLGLLVGVGLALLLELMDTSVKTPSDVTRRVDLPLLAMIPHADDLDCDVEDFRRVCLAAEGDSLAHEAFRELRTNLLFSGPAETRKSLLVSSPSPDDGRTTVAVNLAVAMAMNGMRVLVVDANFRRPALQFAFPEVGEAGLSDVLSGQRSWQDCVHATSVPNLSAMASGKLPPNPNELLGGQLAGRVVAEMAEQYDQVIFDGPPLLLISDAAVLAKQVDGVVLVVRAGINTHGMVGRCRQNLSHIGAHVVGVVLNGVRPTAGGYLRRNYDAFYDYQEGEGELQRLEGTQTRG